MYVRVKALIRLCVGNGIPFLPHVPSSHPVDALDASLQQLDLFARDVVDIVVSKLKRFHANDQGDIDAMVERDLVTHARLLGEAPIGRG